MGVKTFSSFPHLDMLLFFLSLQYKVLFFYSYLKSLSHGFQAPSEAEAECAALCKSGKVKEILHLLSQKRCICALCVLGFCCGI